MRIVALSHIFPPAVDGGSQIVYNLCKNLEKQGNNIFYFSSGLNSTDDFTKNNLFKIFRKLGLPVGPFLSLNTLFQIVKIKPDWIISGPLPTTIIFYTRLLQIITKSKVLFIPCFHENDKSFNKNYFLNLLRHFHLWVFTKHEKKLLSTYSDNIIQHFPGIEKTFLIKNPKIKANKSPTKLLFLGNFSQHKGIIQLIHSLKFLPKNYTLTICGQKTLHYKEILIEKINNVKIIAKKYNKLQEKRLIDTHDVLVLPSIHESFGLVLIEAMARNKPVVALDIPTTRELINKTEGGVLAKSQSPKDIANAILDSKTTSGYKYVKENCTWDTISIWLNEYLQSH